ncbi:hypothetical protein MKW92_027997 [Papaver armeniacum]|nr:hypothetical protein MKW92_027997 [Papaver armeniacum]
MRGFNTDQVRLSFKPVMEPFLPYEPYGGTATAFRRGGIHSNSKSLLKIQVNVFDCGGMVICFSYSHKIVDASSFLNFVNDWAATSRGGFDDKQKVAVVGKPCYIFSSMFPPTSSGNQEEKQEKDAADTQIETDKIEIATKRFVFKNSSIAKLKKKCIHVSTNNRSDYQVDKQEQQLPTRFEALTSLILMCIMDVHRFKVKQIDDDVSDPKQVQYVVGFAINLRAKTIPPLPANSFGNMIDTAIAEIPSNLTGSVYNNGKVVSTIRDSINLVDNEHVEAMKRNLAISCNHIKMLKMIKEGKFHQNTRELLMFSSWCRFPVYEADFGWGKPSWASTSKQLGKNFVMFMDTSSGDGIEAWVSLEEEDMVEFERHEELLAFAS